MRKLSRLELSLPAISLATFLFLGFQHWDRGPEREGLSQLPTCRAETLDKGGDCGCTVIPPVHPSHLLPAGHASKRATLRPFGVHARKDNGEGHRGLEFLSSLSAPVMAPVTGTIRGLVRTSDMDQKYQAQARILSIDADCGIRVSLAAVVDSNLKVGQRVAKGQILGLMAEMISPYGPGRFSVPFEVLVDPGKDPSRAQVCPAAFFDSAAKAGVAGLLADSWYEEKVRRSVAVTCADGSTLSMEFPAENRLCNGRLDAQIAGNLRACVKTPPEREIW
jgi:hypothetical protein